MGMEKQRDDFRNRRHFSRTAALAASTAGLLLVFASVMPSIAVDTSAPVKPKADSAASKVADRAACSSLIQGKQPTVKALQTIAGLGYRWVDLSCMSWANHVSVPKLLEDFGKEAARVEAALATSGLRVAKLTFDSCYDRPFEQYEKEFWKPPATGVSTPLNTSKGSTHSIPSRNLGSSWSG